MSKISDLSMMNHGDIAVFDDMVPILDASTNTVKKIAVNELQGYSRTNNINATITNLCTSSYTIHSVIARVLAGRMAYCEAIIHNGDTGIPARAPAAGSENLLTLPSNLFARFLTTTFVGTLTGTNPSSSWMNAALIPLIAYTNEPLKISRPQSSGTYEYIWNDSNTWIASNTKYANGNVKAMKIHFIAVLKNDVVLPYSS